MATRSGSERPRRRGQGRPSSDNVVGRGALVRAARDLLHTRRPDQISGQEVARVAGADPGLIRYYFGSIATLMEAVAVELVLELRSVLASLDRELPVEEQLMSRVRTYVRFTRENPHVIQVIGENLLRSADLATARRTRDTLGESAREFAELVAAGQESGELWDMDTRLLFAAVLALSQLPFTTTRLMEAVIGEPISDKMLERYESFVVSLILGRDITSSE